MDRLEKRLRLGNPMPFDGLNKRQDRETKAEAKHTPGPWEYGPFSGPPKDRFKGFYVNAPKTETKSGLAWRICDVSVAFFQEREETEANARLIAAAPELLAACVEAAHFFHDSVDGDACKKEKPCVFCMAIAKAKGE